MKRLKELLEKRGAKAKEARTLSDTVINAGRAFTAEERSKIETIQKEVEDIDATIAIESRQAAIESQRAPKLTDGEQRDMARFDIGRMLRSMHASAKGAKSSLDGIEAEMVQEGEREARSAGIESAGLFLPRSFVRRCHERRDLTATGQTSVAGDQGGMIIATEKAGLLDDFFNASVMRSAGATVLEGLVGNLDIPQLLTRLEGPVDDRIAQSRVDLVAEQPARGRHAVSRNRHSAHSTPLRVLRCANPFKSRPRTG